ncbi:ABC transporter ATP-binding protein [Salinicola aestuarinus]|uniref:ABC transporter ATP-binding protein n=1 Tax=Salinicola aestuarinus TaxID=1949082 RepID=UPI000DA24956|nr:ABC transporter ATP-binding protein [Salinicola aestuarinus]
MPADVMIETVALKKHFPVRKGILQREAKAVRALDGISLTIRRGEVLGLVGESGSGKSTLGKTLMMQEPPTSGQIVFGDTEISRFSERLLKPFRRRMQMIFQDPFSSLNPRMSVGDSLTMPLRFQAPDMSASARLDKARQVIETVGLSGDILERFPHEFSGGQRQRIGIARALITDPEFIVADEAVSALDVSVQAQVLNLLTEIRHRWQLTMLFVTHDLAVVGHIADRVAVMYLGKIVEVAPTRELFTRPRHPYTEALMSAVPTPERRAHQRIMLEGDIPSPISPPSGCAFRTRCPYAKPACADSAPPLDVRGTGHYAACHRPELELASPIAT